MRKPLTGEPCAGDPHARFGGRGGRAPFSTPIGHIDSPAAGAISLRQSYECWKSGADPIEFAKEHREFARTFESFPKDADTLFPGWREKLGVHK